VAFVAAGSGGKGEGGARGGGVARAGAPAVPVPGRCISNAAKTKCPSSPPFGGWGRPSGVGVTLLEREAMSRLGKQELGGQGPGGAGAGGTGAGAGAGLRRRGDDAGAPGACGSDDQSGSILSLTRRRAHVRAHATSPGTADATAPAPADVTAPADVSRQPLYQPRGEGRT